MVHRCASTSIEWQHTSKVLMCNRGDDETILHILRCPSRREVHLEHKETYVRIIRDIKAINHLLHLFEVGIEVALLDSDTHSGEDWNSNPNGSTIDRKYRNYYLMKWSHISTKRRSNGRWSWDGNTCSWKRWRADGNIAGQTKNWCLSIAQTFMEWGRTYWSHQNSILYGERKDQYKITRMRLKSEAQVWMDAPVVETLIPIQWDWWKWKLLKKAANSDIAFWLVRNKTEK